LLCKKGLLGCDSRKPFISNVFCQKKGFFIDHSARARVGMVTWHYVQDIKKDKSEAFIEKSNKKSLDRIYGIGIARSNNPGMDGIYYREKETES